MVYKVNFSDCTLYVFYTINVNIHGHTEFTCDTQNSYVENQLFYFLLSTIEKVRIPNFSRKCILNGEIKNLPEPKDTKNLTDSFKYSGSVFFSLIKDNISLSPLVVGFFSFDLSHHSDLMFNSFRLYPLSIFLHHWHQKCYRQSFYTSWFSPVMVERDGSPNTPLFGVDREWYINWNPFNELENFRESKNYTFLSPWWWQKESQSPERVHFHGSSHRLRILYELCTTKGRKTTVRDASYREPGGES